MKNKICLAVFTSFIFLTGCESNINTRGNQLVSENFDKLKTGKTTAQEVFAMCGSPFLQKDHFNWIYISATSEDAAFRKTKVKDQSVIKLRFNKNGVLENIEKVSSQKEVQISFDKEVTPLPSEKNNRKK